MNEQKTPLALSDRQLAFLRAAAKSVPFERLGIKVGENF